MQVPQDVKQQCIFCQIIAKAVPSKIVYEDSACIAVLDINPATPGHLLILPKEHYAVVPQIPDEVLGQIAKVIKALSRTLIAALEAEGSSVYVANGPAAGQRAQHVMIHVIPRRANDGFSLAVARHDVAENEFADAKARLSSSIEKMLGFKPVSEALSHADSKSTKVSKSDAPSKDLVDDRKPAHKEPGREERQTGVGGVPSLDELSEFLAKGGK